MKGWLIKRVRKFFLISLIFLILTAVFTFPSVLHLRDKIIGDGNDSSFYLSWIYVAERQVQNHVSPFSWTNYWRYPVGVDLSKGYDSVIFLIIGLFFYLFTKEPVLVFNITVLSLVFLDGVLSFLYFQKISKSAALGVLGGIIYGYSFYTLARLGGHMNLILVGCFPFFGYALINLIEKNGSKRSFIVFAASIILIYLASLQYIFLALGALMFLTPLFFVFNRNLFYKYLRTFWKNRIKMVVSLTIVISFFVLINFGYIRSFFDGTLRTMPLTFCQSFSPAILDFLQPGDYSRLFISLLNYLPIGLGGIEGTMFVGYVEMFLFIIFLLSKNVRIFKMFIVTSVICLFVITLGCKNQLYPFYYLFNVFPFKAVAEVSRFYLAFYLVFVSAIIYLLKEIKGSLRAIIVACVLALVIFERLPINFYLTDPPSGKGYIQAAKKIQTKAILELPIVSWLEDGRQKLVYDLESVFLEKPTVNGYVHWLGETTYSETFINKFDLLTCSTYTELNKPWDSNKMLDLLKSNDVKVILLHKSVDVGLSSRCVTAYRNIQYFIFISDQNLKKVYDDPEVTVFQIQ